MGDNSFSLQFNPLQRMRTVKDYEKEIEELRNENFELKHQLSHYKVPGGVGNIQEDIQRLLFDSKKSIDILEGENEALGRQIAGMQEVVRKMGEERDEVETRLAANVQEHAARAQLLEEENGRLLKHLEGVNEANGRLRMENGVLGEVRKVAEEQKRYIEEMVREKESVEEMLSAAMRERDEAMRGGRMMFEKELQSYKNALANHGKEKEQMGYELERERAEHSSKISQLQNVVRDLESRAGTRDTEMGRMREYYEGREKEYEAVCRQKQAEEMYLREMSENFARETRDKQELVLRNEEMRRELEQLREGRNELKRRIEVVENEKRALSYKVSQERSEDVRGEVEARRMHHEQRMDSLRREVEDLRSKVDVYKKMAFVDGANEEFLRSFNMDLPMAFNEVIERLKTSYKDMARKIRVMDKEINEVTHFAENNKDIMHDRTMKFLDDFTRDFNAARKDLEECKRYLEKKGRENKELKADNLRLERRVEECRRSEEKMKDLCSAMSSKLGRKDDAMRLEMRAGGRLN